MSDDTDPIYPNAGITLPDDISATHNAALSPLFIAKTGQIYSWTSDASWIKILTYRGGAGILLSKTSISSNYAYRFYIDSANIRISIAENRVFG